MIFDTCGSQECLLHYARHHAGYVPLACSCSQRPYPHELSVHTKLRAETPGLYYDFYDLPIQFAEKQMRWPWSLRLSAAEVGMESAPSAKRRSQ